MKLRAPQVHQLVLVYLLVLIPSCSVGCLLQCVPFYRHALSNYWLVDLIDVLRASRRKGKFLALYKGCRWSHIGLSIDLQNGLFICAVTSETYSIRHSVL